MKDHDGELYRKAFLDAQKDLKETLVYDVEKKADELSDKKLSDMLSPIDWNSVITLDPRTKQIFIRGEAASDGQLGNLRSEAQYLMESNIWKILYETPKESAERALFVSSESLVDLQKGKSMLYFLSLQKKIVDMLLSVK